MLLTMIPQRNHQVVNVLRVVAAASALWGGGVIAAPPRPSETGAYDWSGCHVGVNAGALTSKDQNAFGMAGGFLESFNLFSDPRNASQLANSFDSRSNGFAAGVQLGCDKQFGPLVFGVEADFNRGNLSGSKAVRFGPAGPFVGGPITLASSHTVTVSSEESWYSTFRGRLGLTPLPNLLVYATGGMAMTALNSSANTAFGNDQFFLSNNEFVGSSGSTSTTWTVGAGSEWMFAPRWSLKAEYLYFKLGSSLNYTMSCIVPSCSNSPQTPYAWSAHVQSLNEQIVRVGLNYKLY